MSNLTSKFNFTTVTDKSWTDNQIEEGAFHIPAEISVLEQWITFKLEEDDDGKLKKKPHATEVTDGKYGPFVKYAGVRSENQFTTYIDAYNFVKETNTRDDLDGLDGVGFVFTEEDDFIGIDLDDVVDDDNHIKEFANEFLGSVDSFAEFSPSGSGIHILAKGEVSDEFQQKNDDLGVEIYDEGRFFTVTGNQIRGTSNSVNDCSHNIRLLQEKHFDVRDDDIDIEWTDFDEEDDGSAEVSDARVVKTAKAYDKKFERLYEGSNHVDGNDGANASDLSFCNKLAFWTQHDASQAERIWKNSGRARKKLERKDYVRDTISKGFSSNHSDYSGSYKQ